MTPGATTLTSTGRVLIYISPIEVGVTPRRIYMAIGSTNRQQAINRRSPGRGGTTTRGRRGVTPGATTPTPTGCVQDIYINPIEIGVTAVLHMAVEHGSSFFASDRTEPPTRCKRYREGPASRQCLLGRRTWVTLSVTPRLTG